MRSGCRVLRLEQVHWPSIAGCPDNEIAGRVQAVGKSSVAPPSLATTLLRWALRAAIATVAVQLYRDAWREPLVAVLPAAVRRFLRGGGGGGSLLPSPGSSPRKSL